MAAVDPRYIVQGLVQRGVPIHAALGLAGNYGVESNFNPGINEIAPVVPGSRGGFGFAQWTGPRRRQYEQFAKARGVPLDDVDAQLDFTVWELNNTEQNARDAIYSASGPEEAARMVSNKFLRPGIPHLDRRVEMTRDLMGGTQGNALSVNGGTSPYPTTQNALSGMTPQQQPQNALTYFAPQTAMMDPRMFMTQRTG